MAETTNPEMGVEQGPTDTGATESLLEQAFGDTPPPRKVQEQPAEQDEADNQASDELSPDDLPEDGEEQPTAEPLSADAFEIVHDGQQHKLTRAETIKLAQQGFDYTQKTQALATQRQALDAAVQRANEVEQMVPYVAQDMATVKAYEAQLQQFSNVDWVRLATDDPLEYPKWRAQYDQLLNGYQGAQQQFQQKVQALTQGRQQLTQQRLQQEFPKLTERIPEWKDPAKYQVGAQKVSQYLIAQGADPSEVAKLSDALSVHIAHKAMKYDELVNAKASKVKQLRTAPPVVKPGAVASSDNARLNSLKEVQNFRKAGQKGQSRAQETSLLKMLNSTFK